MKIRTAFVSNSSSASFVLDKRYLDAEQTRYIIEYLSTPSLNIDGWNMTANDDEFIKGYTTMDNGGFTKILKELNVGMKAIVTYEGDGCFLDGDFEEPEHGSIEPPATENYKDYKDPRVGKITKDGAEMLMDFAKSIGAEGNMPSWMHKELQEKLTSDKPEYVPIQTKVDIIGEIVSKMDCECDKFIDGTLCERCEILRVLRL